ncbi:hypothetical protein IFM89_019584 [Coptis chinensis]|uniref:Jacalin-type lectin domain-containing protein n=1 Tax=Coptis chinensis TaxID=261450 RepID=A0A835IDV4_9MAGN|nr:hypothetical protein IFM89_019584 [Coptis chinensis]
MEQRESVILGPWGGPGGGGWDDGVFSTIKQIQVVRGIRMILSIQTEYCAKNGDSIWSERHGYTGADTVDTIQLDYPKEFLKRVTGFYEFEFGDNGMVLVQSLCFFTNKKRYGTFGVERGTYFTSGKDGKVVRFHGRCGAYLDAIGVHMVY